MPEKYRKTHKNKKIPQYGSLKGTFVMSDDFQAVRELEKANEQRGKNNALFSMCDPASRGFDVWALRAKKLAYRHASEDEEVSHQDFLENQK